MKESRIRQCLGTWVLERGQADELRSGKGKVGGQLDATHEARLHVTAS